MDGQIKCDHLDVPFMLTCSAIHYKRNYIKTYIQSHPIPIRSFPLGLSIYNISRKQSVSEEDLFEHNSFSLCGRLTESADSQGNSND